MGPEVRPEPQRAAPFAPQRHPAPSVWSSAPDGAPAATAAFAPVDAADAADAAATAFSPSRLAQLWDGAKGMGSRVQTGLTPRNFEGRGTHHGKAPTQEEINQNPAWRLMGAKESIHANPAQGVTKDLNLEGAARNLGHTALDVVPYWFGGTARSEEGPRFAQRMPTPETYKKSDEKWDGVKSGVGNQLSRGGRELSSIWHGPTSWSGAQSATTTSAPHE